MARLSPVTAFGREVQEIAPNAGIPIPPTIAGMIDALRPPGARSGTAAAAEALGVSQRQVQRYRAAEGTAPRGGKEARGGRRGTRGGPDLGPVRERLTQIIRERAVADIRARGVKMQVEGLMALYGMTGPAVNGHDSSYEQERRIPQYFLPGEALDQPWQDADGGEHGSALDALARGDTAEAYAGFENAYMLEYFGYDSGTVMLEVDWMTLSLGD